MSQRKNIDFLKDILNSIKLIESYSENISKKEFLENQEKQDAIINRLIIFTKYPEFIFSFYNII